MMQRILHRPTPLLSSLLGMAIVLAVLLDLSSLAAIGATAWQRSILSERLVRLQSSARQELSPAQLEARLLSQEIGAARERILATCQAFQTDSDWARFVADIRPQATALGIEIVALAPLPTQTTPVPCRRYGLRAKGPWDSLHTLLERLAEQLPPATHLDAVTLSRQDDVAELYLELVAYIAPPLLLTMETK